MFNIYLGIFIVIALILVAGGAYKLNSYGAVAAGLYGIASIAILILFGLKWFNQGGASPGLLPHTINTCPDYLIYYKRTMPDGSTQDSCIDTIGVSKNGSLKIFPKGGEPPQTDDYYFSLSTKSSDASAKNAELCQRAIAAGLSWEGVTNGESCTSSANPPDSGSGSTAGCPSN